MATSATSRRAFLGAAGVGAAGAAVGTAHAFAGTPSASIADVVLTTVDPAKGVFHINVGELSLPITDLEFASKIAKAIA